MNIVGPNQTVGTHIQLPLAALSVKLYGSATLMPAGAAQAQYQKKN